MDERIGAGLKASAVNEIIEIINEAGDITFRPRLLYTKVKNKFVPIAEVYSRNAIGISKKVRSLLGKRTYYQSIQSTENELVKALGHSVELSIFQYAKTKMQYKNRIKDFSAKEIQEMLQVQYRTALRAIKTLEKMNVIRKVGKGNDTAYYLNPCYAHKGRIEIQRETIRLFSYITKENDTTTTNLQEERIHARAGDENGRYSVDENLIPI